MSEIQRYWVEAANGPVGLREATDGEYVLYTDHLAAMKEKEARIKELEKEMQRREDYIDGCLV